MFGYIKPVRAELRVKEYELYRAVYCGLCRRLGKCTGCVSRMTLSYDFVFLALFRMSLSGESGRIVRKRCAAHPTKKRAVLTEAKELDTCARLSALLSYYKVKDNIADTSGIKKLGSRFLVPAASGMKRRAGLEAEAEAFIAGKLKELSELEASGCASIDRAAQPFGELMARVCAYGYEKGSAKERIASEMGLHIGRFVYIIDALDDLAEDIKSGSYNPFIRMYTDPVRELDREAVRTSLIMELTGVECAVELTDFSAVPEYGEIIRNIIYLGLPGVIDRTLKEIGSPAGRKCRTRKDTEQ